MTTFLLLSASLRRIEYIPNTYVYLLVEAYFVLLCEMLHDTQYVINLLVVKYRRNKTNKH